MASKLSDKEHELLTILADSNEPVSRTVLMKKLNMTRGFAKLAGAFTKPGLGVQHGDNLGRRGFLAAVQINPLYFVITTKGREAIDRPLSESRLSPEDAAADESAHDAYVPTDGDSRKTIYRQIKDRRGQSAFRNALRTRYGDFCLISGCTELHVLEAAHIKPYRGANDHHPDNGLLLRADLHTLFDLDLVGIEPETLQIHVHSCVEDSFYRSLHGQTLKCGTARPSNDAIRFRWERFLQYL